MQSSVANLGEGQGQGQGQGQGKGQVKLYSRLAFGRSSKSTIFFRKTFVHDSHGPGDELLWFPALISSFPPYRQHSNLGIQICD